MPEVPVMATNATASLTNASARKSKSIFGKCDASIQNVRASFARPNGRAAL
jgi:hypothetical protein